MPRTRETYVDTAKGIAIILVVLFHSISFLGDVGLASAWPRLATVLDTFRMPLFFFTAGLFASKALTLPIGGLYRTRIARLLWLYVLWSAIWTIAFAVFPDPTAFGAPPRWIGLLEIPIWPNSSTWFVYGLALYFAAAWLLRSLPIWLQFVPALALTLLFGTNTLNSDNLAIEKIATYFVFFLAAVHFSRAPRSLAQRATIWHALVIGAIYVAGTLADRLFDLEFVPGVRLGMSVLAIATGMSVAVVLNRTRGFGWLTYLGTRTLPIYFIHFYPILIGTYLLKAEAGWLSRLAPLLPVVFTAGAIVIALSVHGLTRRIPWLYSLPMRRTTAFPVSEPGTSEVGITKLGIAEIGTETRVALLDDDRDEAPLPV